MRVWLIQCNRCGVFKQHSMFSKHERSLSGSVTVCKECRSKKRAKS